MMRGKRPWSFAAVAILAGLTLAACDDSSKSSEQRAKEGERIKRTGSVLEGEFSKLKDTGKAWCCDDPSHEGAYNACLMTAKGFKTADECDAQRKKHDEETGHESSCT